MIFEAFEEVDILKCLTQERQWAFYPINCKL
jgi:hypothetical protein